MIRPVVNVRDDKLSRGFLSAVEFCHELSGVESLEVDLSGVGFVTPAFLLPALIHIETLEARPRLVGAGSYLNTVHFVDGGIDSSVMRDSEFKALMMSLSGNTYIPVIKFPTEESGTDKREAILASLLTILKNQGGFDSNVEIGLRYIIGETIDNIVEHAHSPFGYFAAQSYPSKGFTDVCIADTGGTILGSYRENLRTSDIGSDIEALQSAVSGISTKNLPDAENRGFGLRTSITMLTEGLAGEFLVSSGDAAFAANRNAKQFIELPMSVKFKGTIISFRIPKLMPDFSYLRYV